MAISNKPFIGTTATVVTSGTAVAPLVAVPDNCTILQVVNTTAATVYVGWAATSGSFSTTTAAVIVGVGTLSLEIGPKSKRPATGSAGGVLDSLWVDASANGTVVRLVYVNGSTT